MTWIKSGFQNALPQHVVRPPNNSNASSPRSSQCSNKGTKTFPKSYTAWLNLIFGKKKRKTIFLGADSLFTTSRVNRQRDRGWFKSCQVSQIKNTVNFSNFCNIIHNMLIFYATSCVFSRTCSQYGHSNCSRFRPFDATAGAKKQGEWEVIVLH